MNDFINYRGIIMIFQLNRGSELLYYSACQSKIDTYIKNKVIIHFLDNVIFMLFHAVFVVRHSHAIQPENCEKILS